VVGQTGAATLPVTSGAFQKTLITPNSIPVVGFAAKFGPVSAKGASLLYLTYLEATGESFTDIATGVAADSQGNAYVGGYTHSPTFPVTSGAIQSICDPNTFPYNCAFVAKLNPSGTGLVWSTFVEPASFLTAIQLDTQGNVYVAGNNNGFFQAVNAVEPNLNQGGAFVAKINSAGSALLFSSLIGGTDGVGALAVTGLAVDAPGNIYIAGYTADTTFPTTPGAFQPALKNPGTGNSYDAYIGKIGLAPSITVGGIVPNDSSISTIEAGEWVSIYGAISLAPTQPGPATFLYRSAASASRSTDNRLICGMSVPLRSTCKFRISQRRDQSPSWSLGRTERYHPPLLSPNLLLRSTCSMLNTLRASS
jgi:hypothetical protein